MIDRMRTLLKEMDICVLATAHAGKPHCSLMAYVPDAEGRWIYMLTQGKTKKYQSVLENPHVSLLVDTRCREKKMDREKVNALTVYGVFEPCQDPGERKAWLTRIVAIHPHLKELADQSDAEILSIRVDSFLLLEGVSTAHFEKS
jgi:nitroimidazol reductase NimA-like FMN-containing flavoprotein (pyridoxamine 5'-phosphate oxidase superfamily)